MFASVAKKSEQGNPNQLRGVGRKRGPRRSSFLSFFPLVSLRSLFRAAL